jgi:hypothetical protein
MCIYIGEKLKSVGMDKTVKECTKQGFAIGYYEAPG